MIRVREWVLGKPVEFTELSRITDTSVCLDIQLSDGRQVQIVVHDNPDYAEYLNGAILVRGYRPATEEEAANEAKGVTGAAEREVISFSARIAPDGVVHNVRLNNG